MIAPTFEKVSQTLTSLGVITILALTSSQGIKKYRMELIGDYSVNFLPKPTYYYVRLVVALLVVSVCDKLT